MITLNNSNSITSTIPLHFGMQSFIPYLWVFAVLLLVVLVCGTIFSFKENYDEQKKRKGRIIFLFGVVMVTLLFTILSIYSFSVCHLHSKCYVNVQKTISLDGVNAVQQNDSLLPRATSISKYLIDLKPAEMQIIADVLFLLLLSIAACVIYGVVVTIRSKSQLQLNRATMIFFLFVSLTFLLIVGLLAVDYFWCRNGQACLLQWTTVTYK